MPTEIANKLKMAVLEQDREELQQTIDILRLELETREDAEQELAELVKEKNILEDLVVSTQAENERCEEELKKWKAYAKELEKRIAIYEGPNWQETPGVPSTPATIKARKPVLGSDFVIRSVLSATASPSHHHVRRTRRPAVPRLPYAPRRTSSEASLDLGSAEELASEASDSQPEENNLRPVDAPKPEPTTAIAPRRRARHARTESWFAAQNSHEEQVVPALVNAEKKQERRRSLLASSRMSVRRASPEPKESDDSVDELEMLNSPDSKQRKTGFFSTGSDAKATDNQLQRPSSSTADRIETLLTQFEFETGTVLTTFRQMIRRTEQEDEERKASKRKQHDDRAEALQQISDMADDVKQYLDSLEAEAAERENRLQEMLKIVLATAEAYDPTESDDPVISDIPPRRRR